MADSNKKMALSILVVVILLLLLFIVLGATFAYFTAQLKDGAVADIRATTDTTDSLKFEKLSDAEFTADMDNFTEGKGNKMGSSEVKATLVPNSTTNEALDNYNVFFIIDDNDFIYTGTEAELLLKVFDNEGNEITEIDGLKRTEDGFDITTRTGSFLVTEGYEIKAENGTEEQTWRAEVTLVNLNSNQNLNKGKFFKGRIYLAKNEVISMPKINTASTTITNNSAKTTLKIANNTEEIDKYYFAIKELEGGLAYADSLKVKRLANGALEYQESSINEYTFNNLEANTSYKVSSYMIDKNGLVSNIYRTTITTGEDSIPEIEKVDIKVTHNKITLNVTPKAEQNITKYMYSVNDGVTWEESEDSSYTYNGLKYNTVYYLKVKIMDNNNKESNEFEKTVKTDKVPLSAYVKSLYTTQGANNLYLHDSTLANSAGDNSYRYAGADYILTDKALSYNNVYDTDATANGLIKFYCSAGDDYSYVGQICSSSYTSYYYLANDSSKKQYNTLFEITKMAITEEYIKENINNYVCFGSSEETCPLDNLYRIIGVFDDQVKLIKADYASKELTGTDGDYKSSVDTYSTYKGNQTAIGVYTWNYKNDTTINNGQGSNNWSTSLLNKVNLNTNYLNNIGSTWANKIAMTTWYLGGWNTSAITAKEIYGYERGTTVYEGNQTTYEAKVGLMYVSDYGFATLPNNWTTNLSEYNESNIVNNNWLYLGIYEWMINSGSDNSYYAFRMNSNGLINNVNTRNGSVNRPAMYLEASVLYKDGDGSKAFPFRIN